MKAQDLKNSILQMAMEGKLVPQDPNDEPASVLLERIKEEKEQLIKDKKIKRNKNESVIFRKNNHFYEKVGKKGEEVCIDDEIPFDVPDNWEICRLNVVNNIYTGNSINKTEKESKFRGLSEGHNYIATKDVDFNNTIDYENGVKIPKDLEKFRVAESGSVLLCIEGGSAGRKIALTNEDVCFGNKLCCFTSIGIDNEFLYYYLQSPIFKEIFKSEKSGIIGGVSIGKIRDFFVPLPPLNEQKRIVSKIINIVPLIEDYDTFEEELNMLNEEFPKKIKDSILQEAIQGKLVPQDPNDEPASVLLERIKEEKDRLVKEKIIKKNKSESFIFKENNHFYEKVGKNEPICIDDEIPFEIPNNWGWTRIKNISEFVTKGTTPRGGKEAYKNDGIKFLRVENIGKNGEILLDNIKYVSEDTHYNFLKRSILKENDLLISIAGALGRTAIVQKCALPLNTNQAVSFVRWFNVDLIFVPYIEKVINSPEIQKSLLKQSKITAIPNLTLEIIRECIVPIPPLEEQKRIVKKIDEIFNLM